MPPVGAAHKVPLQIPAQVAAVADILGTSIAGGTTPYTYLWAPGSQTTPTINGVCAGNYSSTPHDANGCTVLVNVNILEPTAITVTLTPTNASCNGSNNGSITSVTTGGTGAYTYSWSSPPGGTTSSAAGLAPGTYTLTVTDAKGCTGSQTAVIGEPAPLLAGSTGTNPSCNGSCNGTATATPVGGTSPYSYSWSNPPGGNSPGISNLCAGAYTITVSDAKGCTNTQVVNVVDPAKISGAFAVGNSNCGVCNGTLGVVPSGGTGPYTFFWTPGGTGQGTANMTALCAGIYSVKITDKNGCTANVVAPPLNNTGGPTSDTVKVVTPTCYLTCNGSANSIATVGGAAPYTYAWFDSLNNNLGNTSQFITSLCAGGYFLQVTDKNLCVFIQPVELGSPKPFTPHQVITPSSCSGICNGSITLSPSGGTGAYGYSWSGGQLTSSLSNICAGNYTVTVSDANSCDSVFTFNFVPNTLFLGNMTASNPPCNGICSGSATITMTTGTAPYTYQWSDPLGQSGPTATGLCAGSYTVHVFDVNGCNIQPTTTLVTPAAITAVPTIAGPLCGMCNGNASIAPSGGVSPYTYQWSNGSTLVSANNLCAGVYSVSVKDASGCSSSFSLPVSNTNGPGPSTLSITNINCFGTCNGAATATANGGTAPYTFSWTPGGQTTNTISAQCAGLNFVQVKDSNGCIHTDSVQIKQPGNYNTNQVVVPTTCHVCNGSITLNPSGGTAPYTYSWSGGLPAASSENALCIGIDTVRITDATGCAHIFSMVINSSNSPLLTNKVTNAVCNGSCNGLDSVTATSGSGAYTYSWFPAPGSGQGQPVGKGLCAGSYTVQVTDASGCANAGSFNITQPQALVFSTPQFTNVLCNGQCTGKAQVIPSGGSAPYTYSWKPGINTSLTDSLLCAGSYTLYMKDQNACADSQTVTITQPAALGFTPSNVRPHCDNVPGGSITMIPLGGTSPYTYSWSGPNAFSSTTLNLITLMGGNYTLTVKDANGCTQVVTDTLKPVITLVSNAGPSKSFCTLGSVTLDGSLSINAISYHWFLVPALTPVGDTTVTTPVTPPTGATTYELIVGNSGCTDTSMVTVTSNPPPIVSAGLPQTILTNGSVVIGGAPTCVTGAFYYWSPNSGMNDSSIANPSVDPLTTTIYTVTVTDVNGCKAKDTVVVTVLPDIIFANGITPNGDGNNDRWMIDNIQKFPNNVVEIYNRWGELLFHEKGYQNDWDGTFKGKPLPVGTYYYLVDLHDKLYTTKYSGPITIMR